MGKHVFILDEEEVLGHTGENSRAKLIENLKRCVDGDEIHLTIIVGPKQISVGDAMGVTMPGGVMVVLTVDNRSGKEIRVRPETFPLDS